MNTPEDIQQAVRTILKRRYGADMVTDEMVQAVLAGLRDAR